MASAPTRQPSDVLYRVQVRLLLGSQGHTLELLLDVRRCFDNVDRARLRQLAFSAGYPVHARVLPERLNLLRLRTLPEKCPNDPRL